MQKKYDTTFYPKIPIIAMNGRIGYIKKPIIQLVIAYKLISPVFILILIPKTQIPRISKKYTRCQKKIY